MIIDENIDKSKVIAEEYEIICGAIFKNAEIFKVNNNSPTPKKT